MVYPRDDSVKTEVLINGVWTDFSSKVRGESRVEITRGRADEQGRLSPQTARLTFNNKDNLLSNRNPLSPYYRLLPRSTQCRISAGSGDTYIRYPADFVRDITARASTPDVPALDITGDMEVRVEILPYSWRPRQTIMIASKYRITGNNRSWMLFMDVLGRISFSWSADGITRNTILFSSNPIPAKSGKLAIKVTLDVVNGANKTVQLFTSDSIDGTYTQIGTSTTAGNTSVYAGTAALCVGQGDDSTNIFAEADPFRGRFYKLRVYDGIGGTIRANADFTTQALGATSFVDSAGLTWSTGVGPRITSDRVRMVGELSSIPQARDKTGVDVYVPGTVSGILRRKIQGAQPLNSPLYRMLSSKYLTGYWPLEDGSQATFAASALPKARAATTNKIQFSDTTTLPGAKVAASFIDTSARIIANPYADTITGTSYFTMYFKLDALPATDAKLIKLATSGTARTILIYVSTGGFNFQFIASDGTILHSALYSFGGSDYSPLGKWIAFNLLMTTSGGSINWTSRWSNVAAETFIGTTPTLFAGSVGRIVGIDIAASASSSFVDASFGHIHTSNVDLDFVSSTVAKAANAYYRETAGARLARLCSEEGVSLEISGSPTDTELMGYQGVDTFFDLISECADTDRGILGESRDVLGLSYRTRRDLFTGFNLPIVYSENRLAEPPDAVEDDYGIANDVTVNNTNSSIGRKEITSGTMSVLDPPNGIGRMPGEATVNMGNNSRIVDMASWIARTGSYDGPRIPNFVFGIHRTQIIDNPNLLLRTIALDLGDTTTLKPDWNPPEEIASLVQGYTEQLEKYLWTVTFNTSPAGGYNVGKYDYATVNGTSRYDHGTAVLNASLTTTATTLVSNANSATPFTLDLWTSNSASYPFDVMINGEQITLTQAPTTVGQLQTFDNVIRSVNGMVKTHGPNEPIRLFSPIYYGL